MSVWDTSGLLQLMNNNKSSKGRTRVHTRRNGGQEDKEATKEVTYILGREVCVWACVKWAKVLICSVSLVIVFMKHGRTHKPSPVEV